MTFLNVIMLGGMAALTVPLVIHLFHRSKPTHVYWGAMHLLEQALLENKRRLNLENLLLLLIRCLIPLLLALAMARPVFTQFAQLLGSAKSSLAVVLDDSYSMSATRAGRSAYDDAVEAVGELADSAGRGSDVNVVLSGGTPRRLMDTPSFDSIRINRELGDTIPLHGVGDWGASLEAGIAMLENMSHPVRDLIWVSDFQKLNFGTQSSGAVGRLGQLIRESEVRPRVILYPVGERYFNNVAVTSLEYSKLVQGVGQQFKVRATIKNFGERDWPALRVHFRVNGNGRGVSQIRLGPNEEQQVLFTHVFERAGSQLIEVMAEADSLKFDNSRQASIPVWDRLPVLLIDGDPGSGVLKGETDYLSLALQPYQGGRGNQTNLVEVSKVSALDFSPEKLATTKIAVLANVVQMSAARVTALKEFVQAGGGLMVFPGNRIQVQWYNETLADKEGLLPLKYVKLEGESGGPGARVSAQEFAHPALEFFNDPRNGKLSDAQIRIWYSAELAKTQGRADGTVLAQLEGGAPFLAEREYGQGKVLQCVTPCDADWSNLPLRPFFLPLMQRLVTYLATEVMPSRNLQPGQTIATFFPGREAGRPMQMRKPNGEELPVTPQKVGQLSLVEFSQTQQPGVYTLKAEPAPDTHFVVQPDFAESELEKMSDDGLEELAEQLGAKVVHSFQDFEALDKDRRFGREVWTNLLWLVVLLLFAEMALQQWIGRRKV